MSVHVHVRRARLLCTHTCTESINAQGPTDFGKVKILLTSE